MQDLVPDRALAARVVGYAGLVRVVGASCVSVCSGAHAAQGVQRHEGLLTAFGHFWVSSSEPRQGLAGSGCQLRLACVSSGASAAGINGGLVWSQYKVGIAL